MRQTLMLKFFSSPLCYLTLTCEIQIIELAQSNGHRQWARPSLCVYTAITKFREV